MIGILLAPDAVSFAPASARQTSSTIDAIPVRRIVKSKLFEAPGNAHGTEHGKICRGVSPVGIKQSAIPIEQHAFNDAVYPDRHLNILSLGKIPSDGEEFTLRSKRPALLYFSPIGW